MPSVSARLSVLVFGLVAFVGITPRRAWAGTFDVHPVRVELSEKRGKSALLTVTNRGKEPLRLQASAFSWSQSEAGEVELEATSDIVFFPSILTIAPGSSRKIRVGTSASFESTEKTYRIIVEELPSPSPGPTNGIRILTRMSIPIFVQPERPKPLAHIEGVRAQDGELSITVSNRGNASFILRKLDVSARNSSGEVVFEEELAGWYLLASDKRVFRLSIPRPLCDERTKLLVEAHGHQGATTARLELPELRCED